MGLLFPPKFTGANAPTAEEYKAGKVRNRVTQNKMLKNIYGNICVYRAAALWDGRALTID